MAKSIIIFAALLLVGAFTYVALTDVPVTTQKVERIISNDKIMKQEQ